MKNLKAVPAIHIHPVLLFFLFISFITGAFMHLAVILAIVFIHELGHVLMAIHFKWRIRKIMLWVFGGVMETEEHGTRPIAEEALVVAAGPFQHVLIFIFLNTLGASILPSSVLDLAHTYNAAILLFNLLPICPLDGGKLMSLVFSSLLPYRKAHAISIVLSALIALVVLAVQLLLYPFVLTACCLILFLLLENQREWKQRYYVFVRFLLKRSEAQGQFKKALISAHSGQPLIQVLSQFRRNRRHVIYVKDASPAGYLSEPDCLNLYFAQNGVRRTAGEALDIQR